MCTLQKIFLTKDWISIEHKVTLEKTEKVCTSPKTPHCVQQKVLVTLCCVKKRMCTRESSLLTQHFVLYIHIFFHLKTWALLYNNAYGFAQHIKVTDRRKMKNINNFKFRGNIIKYTLFTLLKSTMHSASKRGVMHR